MRQVRSLLAATLAMLCAGIQNPAPGTAGHDAKQEQSSAARFAYGGNAAEIPAEFLENLVLVPVEINKSQPSLFLLDSTASVSSVSPARAAELGLRDLRDVVLSFPGIDVPFTSLTTLEKPHFSTATGRSYQGTLGADFLGRVVVEIDYSRQTLRLYDPRTYKASDKAAPLALRFVGGMPVVSARLSLPRQKAHESDFVIDTSQDESLVISERFAEAHRLFSSHLKTANVFDPALEDGASVALGRLIDFQIGGYQVRSPLAAFVGQNLRVAADSHSAGVIGGGLLRRFTVTFDYAHQRIFLSANKHFEDYEQEDKSGIAVVAKGPGLRTFEVVAVQPGSPGADAGVQKGDVIAGIDEEAAADLTLASIRSLFRQGGHKYKLLIDRNGQEVQVNVQMRRLI